MKGHPIRYSAQELAFIKRRHMLPRPELHAQFVRRFHRRNVSCEALKRLCERKGWLNGNDGRFKKGIVPANKGKKMPYNTNSARTQFKKGNRTGTANLVYKPIGSTRLSKEGYVERKIHDGLPMQSRWRGVHLLNWEAIHGAVPKGHCVKSLDGDKSNTDPSNWELISRAVLARRNKRFGRTRIPAELEPSAIALAKLENRLGEKRKAQRT